MHELFEAIPLKILEQKEITENGKRRLRVRGIFHRADEQNLNRRIYPTAIIERETQKMSDRIAKGETVYMQADHPQDGVSRIGDTTAILRSVKFDPKSKEVMGEADIISTAKGDDLAKIIEAGGGIGISARGFGSTKPGECAGQKGEVVQEDYSLVTYDFVVGQSTRGAVVTNFAEQARYLAGFGGENEMDLKTLDMEQLKAARPDLAKALEEAALATAEKAVETKKAELATQEEAFKKKTAAAAAEDAADGGADDDEEDANGKKLKKEQREQLKGLRESAKTFGYKLVSEKEVENKQKNENDEIAKLRTQLTEAVDGLKKLEEGQKSLTEQAEAVKVHKYILEKVADEKQFKSALTDRLIKGCKTTKEVDEKLPVERADIKNLLEQHGGGRGTGVTEKGEEKGGGDNGDKTFKTKTGLVLTEQELRTRTLSGIKTELAE
jgi:Prohead core protein serine protease